MDPRAQSRTGALRALAAATAGGAAAMGLARLAARAVADLPAPDALVGAVALALGALAAAVLTAGCAMLAATSCATALGRRWTRTEALATRLVPLVLRRTLTVGLGAGLTLGLGTTALADEIDVGWAITSGSAAQADVVPTADVVPAADVAPTASGHASAGHPSIPAAPAVTVPPTATATPTPAATPGGGPSPTAAPTGQEPARTVTVQAGDSLWRITAGLLPAGSDDARIAATWPVVYAANRDVVGPDPGLIHPGDVLTVPAEVTA